MWNLFQVKKRRQNDVIDFALVSLLLTLNRFQTFFWWFHCWHWPYKCRLHNSLQIKTLKLSIILLESKVPLDITIVNWTILKLLKSTKWYHSSVFFFHCLQKIFVICIIKISEIEILKMFVVYRSSVKKLFQEILQHSQDKRTPVPESLF